MSNMHYLLTALSFVRCNVGRCASCINAYCHPNGRTRAILLILFALPNLNDPPSLSMPMLWKHDTLCLCRSADAPSTEKTAVEY
eukprot:scaffold23489_cov31-Tisochrysis_lutea.AAC.3